MLFFMLKRLEGDVLWSLQKKMSLLLLILGGENCVSIHSNLGSKLFRFPLYFWSSFFQPANVIFTFNYFIVSLS